MLAHELVHIVAKSSRHGAKGIAKIALSGGQLIANRLELDVDDVEPLHALDRSTYLPHLLAAPNPTFAHLRDAALVTGLRMPVK